VYRDPDFTQIKSQRRDMEESPRAQS